MSTPSTSTQVEQWLASCRPKLPLQNPLWSFVHNNVLQAFEDLSFEDGVRSAAALYRARPYLSEAFFRGELSRGRIKESVLKHVLDRTLPGVSVAAYLADTRLGDDREPVALVAGPSSDHLERYSIRDRPLIDYLVPLIASYLDQGMAPWENPFSNQGFWAFFEAAVRRGHSFEADWHDALVVQLDAFTARGGSLDERIAAEVAAYCPAGEESRYCLQTFFVLKGWSGMVNRLEQSPDVAPNQAPQISLKEWLAALVVCVHGLEHALQEKGEDRPNPKPLAHTTRQLGRLERWQLAYEESFAIDFLSTLERDPKGAASAQPAATQVLVCMDDRIESFRRALELNATLETVGVVGFFGVDMRFSAHGATQPTTQCPPVITPGHNVQEVPLDPRRVPNRRPLVASLSLAAYYQTRSLVRGFVLSFLLGLASFVPLLVDVLAPGPARRVRNFVRRWAFPQVPSRLDLSDYTISQRADVVAAMLQTMGIAHRLSPLVAVVAHTSTTTNNPFRQAYGCGACSGNSGEPNARAFAQMANDPEVRHTLEGRGVRIPPNTLFLPCIYDTTLDTVHVLEADRIPSDRKAEIDALTVLLREAAQRNASERSERFIEGPFSPAAAAAHVFARGHDLAQPRPELGHSRVAACVVGRRSLTLGKFLDRRAFLVSYDPTTDDDQGTWLMSAVLGSVPVAVNIAMDYYFSRVDSDGFGCGSKLPLNVVGLLGVITGSKSDLRIGLARQMVELHEPMRPLVIIEADAAKIENMVNGHARLRRLVNGRWMLLGRCDPASGALYLWVNGAFVPWREALPAYGAKDALSEDSPLVFDHNHDRVAFQ